MSERRWGPWRLELETMTLVHDNEYDVSLRRLTSTAAVTGMLDHVMRKDWAEGHVGALVRALLDLHMLNGAEDADETVTRAAQKLDFYEKHAEEYVYDPAGLLEAYLKWDRENTPAIKVTSMRDGFERIVQEAERGPDRTKHGPWRYEAQKDWLYRYGHAWGIQLHQVDTSEKLVKMLEHLEGKSFCTPETLGQFWIAVRYWQRAKEDGLQ